MLNYVYGHEDVIAPFVASMIPSCRDRGFGKCLTVGVVEMDVMIAGWVYHNWNPDAGVIEISTAALPGHYWATRETLKRMYQYPFLYLGCQMVMQVQPETDQRLLRQLAALNYTLIRIPRLLGRNVDGVVSTLTREAWEANKLCQRYKHHIPDPPQQSEAA